MSTWEKILCEALSLFSAYGYEAVTIRQIASAVGIRESSVYNHFKNKRDILDSIVEQASARYEQIMQRLQISQLDGSVSSLYDNIDANDFLELCLYIFTIGFKDDYLAKFRRLLTIEQYAHRELGILFKKIYIDDVLDTLVKVLQKLINNGKFPPGDVKSMAVQFYAPIFLLLYKYDGEALLGDGAIQDLKMHFRHCMDLYGFRYE
ncbi:MAG: TetR/AcrR family transcriptional regulator [Bacillota bacterium]|nr:TetR/AcrR family transcriptional regulator [Bacillota bacterium]HHU60378.1 TetR/AcrR family transcriptional regulator [Natronincola sp.]